MQLRPYMCTSSTLPAGINAPEEQQLADGLEQVVAFQRHSRRGRRLRLALLGGCVQQRLCDLRRASQHRQLKRFRKRSRHGITWL